MKKHLSIALIVESASAGVGRHVCDLTGEFLIRGHRVALIYSSARWDERFQKALKAFRLCGRFAELQLHLKTWPHPSDMKSSILMHRWMNEQGPFDIVHCHSTKAGLLGRVTSPGISNARIYTPHAPITMDMTRSAHFRLLARQLESALAKFTTRIIAVSEEECRHLAELGISPAKLEVISNGIPSADPAETLSQRNHARSALQLRDSDVCIGFVGRLEEQKNPELLLRAFSQVKQTTTVPVKLIVVGDGSLAARLTGLAQDLGVSQNTHWLGNAAGAHWMPAFDIFALSSRYEGQPYVLLEATALPLPVVATRVGGAAGMIQDGRNGFLTPVGEVQPFAAALSRLVSDPVLRLTIARNAAEESSRCSLSIMAERTLSVYREALNSTAVLKGIPCPTYPEMN